MHILPYIALLPALLWIAALIHQYKIQGDHFHARRVVMIPAITFTIMALTWIAEGVVTNAMLSLGML